MLRELAVMAGWAGSAFVVQTTFAMALFDGVTVPIALAYALALTATFALHRRTRGPVVTIVAFGLGWALFAEGIAFAAVASEYRPESRAFSLAALALPLVALLVRRRSTDSRDAWFARFARRVVPVALALALLILVAGGVGAVASDPVSHSRALRVLGHSAIGPDFFEWVAEFVDPVQAAARRPVYARRWADFQASPEVTPALRVEVTRACGGFAATNPRRACDCAKQLLDGGFRDLRDRRHRYLMLAFAAVLPLSVALLFAWRGRQPAHAAASGHT